MKENEVTVEKKNIWQKMSDIQGLNIQINKDKAAHGYSYATLDQIMDKLSPILHEHKLLVYHQTDYDPVEKCSYLKTTVRDIENPDSSIVSMTYIDNTITLQGQNKAMVTGSLITYYRRYHVTSLFGLTTETDTDAGGAGNGSTTAKKGAGPSVEAAGSGEKSVDFESIFKNMIAKGKTKELVSKQLENYKTKMTPETLEAVNKLITEMK